MLRLLVWMSAPSVRRRLEFNAQASAARMPRAVWRCMLLMRPICRESRKLAALELAGVVYRLGLGQTRLQGALALAPDTPEIRGSAGGDTLLPDARCGRGPASAGQYRQQSHVVAA